MFERNPVDNAALVTVAVEIVLDDGAVVSGRAALPQTRAVHRLLEGTDAFLYVEPFGEEGTFIPKSSIKALKVINPVKPRALHVPLTDASAFDPHRILGVAPGASFDEIRQAYHQLTKLYHPDMFASVTLPPEVATYIDARAKQINAAFRVLKSPRKAAGTAA